MLEYVFTPVRYMIKCMFGLCPKVHTLRLADSITHTMRYGKENTAHLKSVFFSFAIKISFTMMPVLSALKENVTHFVSATFFFLSKILLTVLAVLKRPSRNDHAPYEQKIKRIKTYFYCTMFRLFRRRRHL